MSLPSPSAQSDWANPSSSSNRRKKRKTSEIASRYAQSAAQIDKDNMQTSRTYEYGRTVVNKLRCITPYQAALARRNIENMLFDVQYGSSTLASVTPQCLLTHDKPTTPLQTVTSTYSYHQIGTTPLSMLGLLNSSDIDF